MKRLWRYVFFGGIQWCQSPGSKFTIFLNYRSIVTIRLIAYFSLSLCKGHIPQDKVTENENFRIHRHSKNMYNFQSCWQCPLWDSMIGPIMKQLIEILNKIENLVYGIRQTLLQKWVFLQNPSFCTNNH